MCVPLDRQFLDVHFSSTKCLSTYNAYQQAQLDSFMIWSRVFAIKLNKKKSFLTRVVNVCNSLPESTDFSMASALLIFKSF